MSTTSPYSMTISLNVLNHLGINLYSNVPAVLSEIVANSWDADAQNVDIQINQEEDYIIITDDGDGMTKSDINNRYLHVGYQRRLDPAGRKVTNSGREVMGRKGIGKLSVFSIARDVTVHSVKDGEKNGFQMLTNKIEQLIKEQSIEPSGNFSYKPITKDEEAEDLEKGTRIVLRNLKKGIRTTETFSRRRLARRFSIIGTKHDFNVSINDKPIDVTDRDFFNKIEFVWYLGDESIDYANNCLNAKEIKQLNNVIKSVDEHTGEPKILKISGWVGTFDEFKNVEADDELNSIVLLARGKLIREDILRDFKEGRMFSKYLIGEIQADFLDNNDDDDIVTSDRQRIIESDYRWKILSDFFEENILKPIGSDWTNFRHKNAVMKAREIPAIDKWFSRLKGDNKKIATSMFGKIDTLKLADLDSKKELYKASILAFEKLALKKNLSALDSINDETNFEVLKNILASVDELEETHYFQITKSRLEVIEKFKSIVNEDLKEKVLQEYIFKHLWLLHPSWERAASNKHIEDSVNAIFKRDIIESAGISDEERRGRMDLQYKTMAGKNIIIELKRYGRTVNIHELLVQVSKYRRAMEKCLLEQFPEASNLVEIICILGSPPTPHDDINRSIRLLYEENARFITYDTLIDESLNSYKEYIDRQVEISEILEIVEGI